MKYTAIIIMYNANLFLTAVGFTNTCHSTSLVYYKKWKNKTVRAVYC